jgi:hypothetical protein
MLFEILEHFRESRLNSMGVPTWWTQFDPSLKRNAKFISNLALVGHPWLAPARRLALHTVRLYLTQSNADSFHLMAVNGWGSYVKRLILDFPLPVGGTPESTLNPALKSLTLQLISACPSLLELHLDDVPKVLASNTAFVLQVLRQGTFTTFGLRASGPEDAFLLPCTSLRVPSMARIRTLILSGLDLDASSPTSVRIGAGSFRALESLHLHVCSLSAEFISALGQSSLRDIYLGRMPIDAYALSRSILNCGTVQTLVCDKVYAVVDDDVGGTWVPEEIWGEIRLNGVQVHNRMRDLFPYWYGPSDSCHLRRIRLTLIFVLGLKKWQPHFLIPIPTLKHSIILFCPSHTFIRHYN